MTKDELKLALKHAKRDERHLSNAETRYWCDQYKLLATQAIEALAQPETDWERVARIKEEMLRVSFEDNKRLKEALMFVSDGAQPSASVEQEPVGWIDSNDKLAEFMHKDLKAEHDKRDSSTQRAFQIPVYTTPPQRHPLTEQEIGAILEDVNAYGTRLYTFARAIEVAHGIKV